LLFRARGMRTPCCSFDVGGVQRVYRDYSGGWGRGRVVLTFLGAAQKAPRSKEGGVQLDLVKGLC
jgi:hypothetical protein